MSDTAATHSEELPTDSQEITDDSEPTFTIRGRTFRRNERLSTWHAVRMAKAERTGQVQLVYAAMYDMFMHLVHEDEKEAFETFLMGVEDLKIDDLGGVITDIISEQVDRPSSNAASSESSSTGDSPATGSSEPEPNLPRTSKVVSLSAGTVKVTEDTSSNESPSGHTSPS